MVSEALVRFNKSRKKKCVLSLVLLLVSPLLSLVVLPYFVASEARYSFRYSRLRRETESRVKKANQQIESSVQEGMCGVVALPKKKVVTESENAAFLFNWKEGVIMGVTWVMGVALSPLIECVVLVFTFGFFFKVFT